MKRETKYALRYISKKTGEEKTCYPMTVEQKDENLAYCKAHGIRVLSCKKLYPFSTEKNQHNFMLIKNICYNTKYDMDMGDIPMDEAEYDRLSELEEKAIKFFDLPLPVAWLPWEDYQAAQELANLAIMHRQDVCIENGRYDLVQYC